MLFISQQNRGGQEDWFDIPIHRSSSPLGCICSTPPCCSCSTTSLPNEVLLPSRRELQEIQVTVFHNSNAPHNSERCITLQMKGALLENDSHNVHHDHEYLDEISVGGDLLFANDIFYSDEDMDDESPLMSPFCFKKFPPKTWQQLGVRQWYFSHIFSYLILYFLFIFKRASMIKGIMFNIQFRRFLFS